MLSVYLASGFAEKPKLGRNLIFLKLKNNFKKSNNSDLLPWSGSKFDGSSRALWNE